MSEITVYDLEKQCGLEEQIRSQASVAFVAPILNGTNPEQIDSLKEVAKAASSEFDLSFAAVDDPDLYQTFSILVSTAWNKNDDIFEKDEVWAARHTPRFKPTNLEHDEKQMVGGIINSWPVDVDFNLIPDDTEASLVPDDFHLLVSSVIFRQWQDPELKARAEELIAEIEEGDKFVSMECLFRGFDYGVVGPDGTNHVVARTEKTAFLSQHLRAYGGNGTYQNHKLGRVLRRITFSGKGYVNKPANPGSIIFDRDHIFSFANVKQGKSLFLENNGVTNNTEKQLSSEVIISKEEKTMSNEILSDQNKELKDSLAAAQAEIKELTEKLSEASVSTYENKIKELESTVAEFETKVSDLESQISEATSQNETLAQDLASKSETLEQVQADMHKMEEDKKKKYRKDKMAEAGLSEEDVEAKYETFAQLDDESFDSLIETIAGMKEKAMKDEDKKKKEMAMKEKAMKDAYAEEEVVEETEASEIVEAETEESDSVALSSESDTDELSETRASLQAWVESFVMNNKESN